MNLPEQRPGYTPLYCLSGPTASGKSDLVHKAVERLGGRVLSADSMMVYRGMDIGTAKPSRAERMTFDYAGLDLTGPDVRFSTGDWLRAVQTQLDDRPTFVVGGTGLYFRALLEGLTPEEDLPQVDPDLSAAELRERIQALDATALDRLADPENPRRLARALQWLLAGKPFPNNWRTASAPPRIPVLQWPVDALNRRIALRAEQMFSSGLLEEAAALKTRYETLPGTAAQAIGYREAFEVLEGSSTVSGAVEKVTVRTRRYAKRQRTWFRNQMNAVPLDGTRTDVLDELLRVWVEIGPFWFNQTQFH
jgi:tRNA dimethylallyltransferase